MTNNEAIEALKLEGGIEIAGNPRRIAKFFEALDMAISALKEVQQYRAIGTVEECRDAVGKQKPKAPDYEGDGYDDKGELIYDTWICPSCGEKYEVDYDDYKHCPECGQRLDIGG